MTNPDLPEDVEITMIECPECGMLATIESYDLYETRPGEGCLMWRTSCLNGHHRDNYWYHVEAGTDFSPDSTED